MKLDYVPLLQVQRELHDIPPGQSRFQQYLRTIWSPDGTDGVLLPLLAMNPMGKGHVSALLDAFLAIDADGIAASTLLEDAAPEVSDVDGDCKLALVIADDLKGGWTNRYDYEFTFRFGSADARLRAAVPISPIGSNLPHWTKHFWLTCILWSSEAPSERAVRESVLTAVHRVAYMQRRGSGPRTLRDMLAQEGHVMAMAGCTEPVLDEDDIAYTREVLIPYLDADDERTAIQCLFGDAAGPDAGLHAARPEPVGWPGAGAP